MMTLVNGATYRLINRADTSQRSLNVVANSGTAPASLANVCLWSPYNNDTSQQWVYKEVGGNKYFVCKLNQNVALDLFTGSSSTPNVTNYNAHVYSPSTTSYLKFEDTSDYSPNHIRIRLANNTSKYLTANQGSNGSSAGKDVNAAGNVYFYTGGLTDRSQDWQPVLIDGGGSSDPYAALNWSYVFTDPSNAWGYWGYSPTGNSNSNEGKPWVHWGIDIICNTGTAIRSPAAGTVFATGSGDNRGNYIVLKMDQVDPVSGRSMYVRFLHMRDPALVSSGRVNKNQALGYVGNTGTKTPHLHLDINTKTSAQADGTGFSSANTINPVKLFPNISFPNNYYWE